MTGRPSRFLVGFLVSAAWLACSPALAQESDRPLPDRDSFLQEVRKNLRSDRLLLSRYTFTEKVTIRTLAKSGKIKKVEQRVYEVYPSLDDDLTYRKLISKNGKLLDSRELDKQDREYDKKLRKRHRKLDGLDQDERARASPREAEERRKEEQVLDELPKIYDIQMLGRDTVKGHPGIVLSFKPRRGYVPKTKGGKILAKVAGTAWLGEYDHQLMRVEAKLVDSISFGLGILARLNKGATAVFERQKVNDEIWLPAKASFSGTGRLLLFKGLNLDISSEYSDYRKFTVRTSVEFVSERKPE